MAYKWLGYVLMLQTVDIELDELGHDGAFIEYGIYMES